MNIASAELHDLRTLQNIAELAMLESVTASAAEKVALIDTIKKDVKRYLVLSGHCCLKASKSIEGSAKTQVIGYILIKEYKHLANLFVLPDHQSRGIGSLLLASGIAECKLIGKTSKFLSVNSSLNAVRFYRRHGFIDRVVDKPVPAFALPMQLSLE